jgi:hypothetical protein
MHQMTGSRTVVAIALALLISAVLGDVVSPELVQVGNLRVETKVEGTGDPPVILESGFTGGSEGVTGAARFTQGRHPAGEVGPSWSPR